MCASSTDRRPPPRTALRAQRGFTLAELVGVLILVSVLAAVALPRLDSIGAWRSDAWREQVLGSLRHARALAQGHRRLVCVNVATGTVDLSIAADHPASACSATVAGPDGQAAFAHDASAVATTLTPAGTLYFQPSGRVTRDGAGLTPVNATIAIDGEASIGVVGETGHVE